MSAIATRCLVKCNSAVSAWKGLPAASSLRRMGSLSPSPSLSSVRRRRHHCAASDPDPRTKDYFNDYRHRTAPAISTDFDPSNTEQVFRSMSTFQLFKYNAMFTLLSYESLTQIMIRIMARAVDPDAPPKPTPSADRDSSPMTAGSMHYSDLSKLPGMDAVMAVLSVIGNVAAKPLVYLVRKQYYPLFTGGEDIDRCIAIAQKYYENNIGLTIDNSTEEGHSKEVYANNMAAKKQLIDVSHEKLRKSVVFMALKMTALCPSQLLEEMTSVLNEEQPADCDPTPFLSAPQLVLLEETMETLLEICRYAKDRGIGVWLDAEQFSRQKAMNYVSRRLMAALNNDGTVWLYNTYQCYLREAGDWIAFDVDHAKRNGYCCGVKLVRGAYFDYEALIAHKEGRESPVHKTKADTDAAYDGAVEYLMSEIAASYGSVGLAVCTHNRGSLERAIGSMDRFGIPRDDKHVMTAQLNGMVDNLTYSLGYSGYNALKLMPYGEFNDVWPYLMRRLEENSSILNGSQQERAQYTKEMKRRIRALVGM